MRLVRDASGTGGAPKAPDIRGEDEEASAAEQPPTGHIDDFDRLAQQVPDVEATAATTDQELPLLRRSKRIRKPIQRGAPKAPDIRGEDEEASAAEQPPTGHIDDFDRLAQQVPDVEATAATTDQELPLLRRSKRIRKPIQRF
ncbi:hypothetical protein HPB52_025020 [Rhipicephalus sanguineus]|uniref:Uncharacterized protein n=1 Tax=Rhipicephalus sanguineus TaxID=34632 RepID=A0A9D4TDL1_RHISA|nr:hypothetical protein HPB52_025020 [Rhipicephalus sanguineus]